jgi:hypothetical protein
VPKDWSAQCKDCGVVFSYSDIVHKERLRRGLSAPERCPTHRRSHATETRAMGSSHFGLAPVDRIDILGGRFLGSFDRGDRGKPHPREIDPDPSGLDLGLRAEHVQEIYNALDANRVLVIVAPTGAGKSTVIPFRLLSPLETSGLRHDHFTPNGRQIIVTQPRRVAASDIPRVIARKLYGTSVGPGSEIGYRHGQDREQTDPWNRLVFVTDGTLLNWLTDHRAGEFSIIIIDEAHERSTTIDLILALLRTDLIKYPHLRLIVLSATIHAENFVRYFESVLPGQVWQRDFQECEKAFGYECRWWTKAAVEPSYMAGAMASKIIELIKSTKEGGILGFMPGEEEIKATISMIEGGLDSRARQSVALLPLYSALEPDAIARAKDPIKPIAVNGQKVVPRRVVIATNIAETSLTIPDVVHVVDSGLIKESIWDVVAQTEELQTRWHSQAGCRQRWGRAGRNQPGIAHTLYTREQFESFAPFTRPAIVREALDDLLIKATRAGVTDFESFAWLDAPDKAEVGRVMGAIEARRLVDGEGDPTRLGSEIFDVYQRIGRYLDEGAGAAARALDMASLLLLADQYACLIEAATFLVLLPHLGDNLYHRRNGLFRFESNWPVEERDRIARVQGSLRAGCIDDLDLAVKIAALYEGLVVGGRKLGGKEWATRAAINAEVIDLALASREGLLGAFVREARERGIRRLDLSLNERVRLLVAHAWPDKRITTESTGGWATAAGTRGKLSLNTLARKWRENTSGYTACFGRPLQDADSPSRVAVSSVVVRSLESRNDNVEAQPLAKQIHSRRVGTDAALQQQRLLVDQMFPVGTEFAPEVMPTVISAPDSETSYQVSVNRELVPGSATILSRWQGEDSELPTAVLDPHPLPVRILSAAPAEKIAVRFVRRVEFPPTGGTSEFVCRTGNNENFYVAVADLSFSSANPALDGYIGTERKLTYVGQRVDGQPIASQLFDLENGWQEIRKRPRYWGSVSTILPSEGKERRAGIEMPDPREPSIFHFATVALPNRHRHLEAVKAGDIIYFSFWPERREPWVVTYEEEMLGAEAIAALKAAGIAFDGAQLTASKPPTARQLYTAISTAAEAEPLARRFFQMSHAFDIDPDSIDTDSSLGQLARLLEQACATWKDAWSGDKATIRDRVKAQKNALKSADVSPFGAAKVRAALDGAWEIQDLRYKTEELPERAAKISTARQKYWTWVSGQQANVDKLTGWLAGNLRPEKRLLYSNSLRESQQNLAKAAAELRQLEARWAQGEADLPGLEREIASARTKLAQLRSAGLQPMDLSGGRSISRVKAVAASEEIPRTGPATRPTHASLPRQPSEERRLRYTEDQVRRLSERGRVGLLGLLFGAQPAKSIIQTVAERFSVTIDVEASSTILVRANSKSAIQAAEAELNRRLV